MSMSRTKELHSMYTVRVPVVRTMAQQQLSITSVDFSREKKSGFDLNFDNIMGTVT